MKINIMYCQNFYLSSISYSIEIIKCNSFIILVAYYFVIVIEQVPHKKRD